MEERKKRKFNRNTLEIFVRSAIYLLIAIFAVFTLTSSLETDGWPVYFYYALTFLSIASLQVIRMTRKVEERIKKINFIKYGVFLVVYLTCFLLCLLYKDFANLYYLVGVLYFATIFANRFCMIFERKRKSLKISNIVLSILSGLLLTVFAALRFDEIQLIPMFYILITAIMIVANVIVCVTAFAFARIHLGVLIKIIRKSYALEILYGLFVLIITFSLIFYELEDSMATYGDALWYSFAIVTTIGFGDFSATGTITRILSVILGIYGIVVVALITSIIVNFYSETKDKENDHDNESILDTIEQDAPDTSKKEEIKEEQKEE